MPKHDYLFVDESGDPGYALDAQSGELLSTPYYTSAVLHIVDDAFRYVNMHMSAFRFYSRLMNELKIPAGREQFTILMEPIGVLAENGAGIFASVVYLDKRRYTGRYLKPGDDRGQDAVRFRNFVLRRLLEHHFKTYSLQSSRYDLVLDRVDMTKEEREGLENYLAGNLSIPRPNYITHASSIYVESLQIVHHVANGFKDAVTEGIIPAELSFVSAVDITQ